MKKLIIFIILLTCTKWSHAFQQTLFPSSITVVGTADRGWNNRDNALIEDGLVASTVAVGLGTKLLKAAFAFTIPPNATIVGLKFEVKENQNTDIIDNQVVLFDVNASTTGSADRATTNSWPTPLAYVTYGSSTDLWGKTWKPSDVNSPNFGFGISAIRNAGGSQTAEIDVIRGTVFYSVPTTIYNGVIFNAKFP